MYLIALPGWTVGIFLVIYLSFLIFSIVCVLKYEKNTTLRVAFTLMSIFIPLFCVGYVIYALSKKRNSVVFN